MEITSKKEIFLLHANNVSYCWRQGGRFDQAIEEIWLSHEWLHVMKSVSSITFLQLRRRRSTSRVYYQIQKQIGNILSPSVQCVGQTGWKEINGYVALKISYKYATLDNIIRFSFFVLFLVQRSWDFQKPIYVCSIDFEMTFYRDYRNRRQRFKACTKLILGTISLCSCRRKRDRQNSL